MTQSKDGKGRTPSGGRLPGDRQQGAADGGGESFPMLPHPSAVSAPTATPPSDTNDMQDLLRRIATQIAEAEQRQGVALEGMQSRLTNLAGQAEAVTAQAPVDLKPSLGSIETRIAQIAETVEAVGREIRESDSAGAGPGASAATPSMHVRGFGRGQVRGSNEVPAGQESPVGKAPASVAGAGVTSASASTLSAKPSGMGVPRAASPVDSASPEAGGPWDKQSADALARIFSDEEDVAAGSSPTVAPSVIKHSPPPAAANTIATVKQRSAADLPRAPRTEPPALASASTGNPLAQSTAAGRAVAPGGPLSPPQASPAAPAHASRSAPGAAPASAVDRDWLNARFADIAAQIERSLKESRPERTLSALGPRFDKLETSLTNVLTAVRAGKQPEAEGLTGQALSVLDAQVNGLKAQIDAAVLRLASLDALKAEVATIAQRLGALDRLESAQTQLSSHILSTRGDFETLLRALDEQKTGAGVGGRATAADPRLDKLHSLVETQTVERRDNDTATVAVLHAIQVSIDQLTNRMAQFEDAVATAVLGGIDASAAEAGHGAQPAPSRRAIPEPDHAAEFAEEPIMPPARPARATAPVRPEAATRGSRREAAAAAPAEAAIPRTRRGIGNIMKSGGASDTGESVGGGRGRIAEEAAPRAHQRDEADVLTAARDDMLGAARKAVGDQEIAEEAPEVDVETIAARLPGQKRAKPKSARGGFFTFEKAGTRPIQMVAIVALLAAGAGMLYGTMAERPQPVRLDKPKSTVGKIGALAPDAVTPRGDAGASSDERPRTASENSLRPTVTTTSGAHRDDAEFDAAAADDMRAADMKEAALSTLKPGEIDATPLHTSSSSHPRPDGQGLTTGILIDSGAPMPTVRDLRRYSEEQRMARISSQLGDKAVQRTERDHGAMNAPAVPAVPAIPAAPARHTPDPQVPESVTDPAPVAAGASALNSGGLPPALIGPMSLRVAAAKGDPSAEFEVASRFAQGKGVQKDFAKAAEWYQRAASRGSAPAQYRLGGLYERGIGVKQDAARARTWYKRAAELGNVKAMHNLAVMHTQRDAGEPDYASASQWFTRAASFGLADSQFNLAILHENGMGVPKNMQEAYMWYALAAERGDPEAGKRRDGITARMTPSEIERGRLAVAKWRPRPTEPEANDPMLAGQAWRARNGLEQSGQLGAARPAAAAPQPSSAATQARSIPQEAEIIDLSSAAIDAQMKAEAAKQPGSSTASASPPGSAMANEEQAAGRKKRVPKAQSPGDIERMLAQFGYNPSALKKARPGGSPEETPTVPPPKTE